jgi:hypothetical protein
VASDPRKHKVGDAVHLVLGDAQVPPVKGCRAATIASVVYYKREQFPEGADGDKMYELHQSTQTAKLSYLKHDGTTAVPSGVNSRDTSCTLGGGWHYPEECRYDL